MIAVVIGGFKDEGFRRQIGDMTLDRSCVKDGYIAVVVNVSDPMGRSREILDIRRRDIAYVWVIRAHDPQLVIDDPQTVELFLSRDLGK